MPLTRTEAISSVARESLNRSRSECGHKPGWWSLLRSVIDSSSEGSDEKIDLSQILESFETLIFLDMNKKADTLTRYKSHLQIPATFSYDRTDFKNLSWQLFGREATLRGELMRNGGRRPGIWGWKQIWRSESWTRNSKR